MHNWIHMTPRSEWKFPEERDRSVENLQARVRAGLDTFTIADDGKSITCHGCGRTSHNGGDVDHKFCPCSDMFHNDIALALKEPAE